MKLKRTESELLPVPFEQAFRHYLQTLLPETPDKLQALRLQALSRFDALGFPTRRAEAWKYITLRPLLNQSFLPYEQPERVLSREDLAEHFLSAPQGVIQLVFVNGRFNETLSQNIHTLPENVFVGSLKTALQTEHVPMTCQLIEQMSTLLAQEPDAFAALNAALFEDGALVSIPENTDLEPLVQILFIHLPSAQPRMTHIRNVIQLGANARANLAIETISLHEQDASGAFFHNSVQDIHLADGAQATCTVVCNGAAEGWHFSKTMAQLSVEAKLNLQTVTLGGQVTRHSIYTLLQGEKAELQLNGLDVLCDQNEVYHHTVTEHWVPHCVSNQYYKGILDDESKSEFNGMVFVAQDAHGTDSRQLNKNLLLSENARVWTRPQLQINADDVKCAHGATVGQLEKDQLFYLASRGLDFELAQGLLTYGFAEEIVQRIENEALRHYLDTRILENLHAASGAVKEKIQATSPASSESGK